jgi:ATP-dependent RNA helicase DeaD
MNDNRLFARLGLCEETLAALQARGFEEPTPIQEQVIPLLLQQAKDIIGQAQTGTGKTAAFGLPILEKILPSAAGVQALILAPTRELALQVAEELNSLKGRKKIKILPVYGGQAISGQIKALKRGVDIVVGTPGRVIDHIERKTLKLADLSYLVLDEADEMLNMGFIEDVERILEAVGPQRRMLLFSATLPERIRALGTRYLGEYELVVIKPDRLVTGLTEHIYFEVHEQDKLEALSRIIDIEENFYGLVFCRTKVMVDQLAQRLAGRGVEVEALHGDISQAQRETILDRFRKRRTNVLVATDVAARGIDIVNLTHVINFSLPQGPESYVHRIGRTGRAGNNGMAITFVTPTEYRKLTYIKRAARVEISKRRLPRIDDVIQVKKDRILGEIEAIAAAGGGEAYQAMADDLLAESDPRETLAAVLSYALRGKLDSSKYREIRDVAVDRKGKTRLFIQLGRRDDMTKRKLVRLIEAESGVKEWMIQGVQIYDIYSFVTVPFHAAETIIRAFRTSGTSGKGWPGKQLAVEIARDPHSTPLPAARGRRVRPGASHSPGYRRGPYRSWPGRSR